QSYKEFAAKHSGESFKSEFHPLILPCATILGTCKPLGGGQWEMGYSPICASRGRMRELELAIWNIFQSL
ncbi:hypothetical protein CH063_13119, partial [Colletotrichum higginsianum]